MSHKTNAVTRRDFLRNTAGATLAGAAGLSAWAQDTKATKAKVVLVRDPEALDAEGVPSPEVLQRMLDNAMMNLFGADDPAAPWKGLFNADDTVGIKTNVWRFLHTPKAIEAAIKRRLVEAGVPENRIGLDDRGVRTNPLFQQATALINVRPMHTHHWAGVGSLLKNYIMFHEKPYTWHKDACANLAGLWQLPAVKGKTRLNVLVMLSPLFHGKGPHHFQKKYTWPYKGLLLGTDPVAVDATGLRILEAKRLEFFGGQQPFAVSPHHIRIAEEEFHLGVANPAHIEVRKLGWTQDILI